MCNKRELNIVVSDEINSKSELISSISEKLKTPFEFGLNWDALDDILTDLSWLDEDVIHIKHEEISNIPKEQREVYIEIMADAVVDWQQSGKKRLIFSMG